jgi:hypothetical protein
MTDMWVLYGEQDYPKNFHAAGFTPKMLQSLAESVGNLTDIEVSEADTFGESNAWNWSLQMRAIKAFSPKQDNISPDGSIPAPPSPAWWPIASYPEPNERPLTPEEIDADIEKAKLNKWPTKFNFYGAPDDRIWNREEKPVEPESTDIIKEEKDGLDSGIEGSSDSKRGRTRKTS